MEQKLNFKNEEISLFKSFKNKSNSPITWEEVRNHNGSRGFRVVEFSLEEITQNKSFTELIKEKKLPF